jgi:UDP-glucose 4-epimerase
MISWVVGAGGLLGKSVAAALPRGGHVVFTPPSALPWSSPAPLGEAFASHLAHFLSEAALRHGGSWSVLWCAGRAVVASPAADAAADLAAWRSFVEVLESSLSVAPKTGHLSGHVVLASSAGGVWAGHQGAAITESTPTCAISGYGRLHLAREDALTRFASRHESVRTAIVRVSNLYGPGQRLDKPQGLVSQISRALIHRRPIHVYVPLDTVRDYLFAADAGAGMGDVLELLRQTAGPGEEPLRKVLASEDEVSVGGILAVFRRITRRRVPVVAGVSAFGQLQPRRLRFRSEVWAGAGHHHRTPLLEGVAEVYRHQLALYARGALPP